MTRKKTKQIKIGNLYLGGENPLLIQSMTSLPIDDFRETIKQIKALAKEGSDLVRLAVKDLDSISFLKKIIKGVQVPIIADIHFNHKIALESIKAGVNKIRINPGNISNRAKIKEIIKAAKDYQVPIRIGVNAGSINRKRYKILNPENLVAATLDQVKFFEDNDFSALVLSIKSSDLQQNILANRLLAQKTNYPLHIGLTEAGFGDFCLIASSIFLGHLLLNGIGDTIRISMTGDPIQEVRAARKVLEALEIRKPLLKVISCPTCGRKDPSFNLLKLAQRIERQVLQKFSSSLQKKQRSIKIAIMGCEVNGPGEAKEADLGVAGGQNNTFFIFSAGQKLRKVSADEVELALLNEIEKIIKN